MTVCVCVCVYVCSHRCLSWHRETTFLPYPTCQPTWSENMEQHIAVSELQLLGNDLCLISIPHSLPSLSLALHLLGLPPSLPPLPPPLSPSLFLSFLPLSLPPSPSLSLSLPSCSKQIQWCSRCHWRSLSHRPKHTVHPHLRTKPYPP